MKLDPRKHLRQAAPEVSELYVAPLSNRTLAWSMLKTLSIVDVYQ